MRAAIVLFMFMSLFVSPVASATLVIMSDGDVVDYDAANDYAFSGSLTASDNILTYGFNVEIGELPFITVTAPAEFYLYADLSTAPDFGGTAIVSPSVNGRIEAGTSFSFGVDGDFFVGQTQWLSVGVDQTGIDGINTYYRGSLPISEYSATSPTLPGNDVVSPVPVPASIWLLAPGFAALAAVRRQQRG